MNEAPGQFKYSTNGAYAFVSRTTTLFSLLRANSRTQATQAQAI